ncbi:hypothetical protein Palpr_2371 [Paludibacter propionicigenes WB4]|uniref:Transmembrane protein n=1 Tax=Paludibacter propionicigenes (strain DSM 17365 / JCM 13257 / WB4) TaxID=694427 RepID=E4T710_PALPW|nr:hypothetical protein Palpr_2371 [Paludibacter propionicigenes WB4]
MKILISILLLLTFTPVFMPFGKLSEDKRGQQTLTVSYAIYLLSFSILVYCALFRDLYWGFELGDLMIYFVFTVTMVVSNFGIGLRNKTGREIKYFFSTINIIASIYLIIMLWKHLV